MSGRRRGPGWLFSVRDDRGERRRVVKLARLKQGASLMQVPAVALGFVGIWCVFVAACVLLYFTYMPAPGTASVTIEPWVVMVGAGLAAAGVLLASRQMRVHSVHYINACKDERACAGCAYHLGGLPVEDDGCTICPECGAAWKMWPDPIDRRGS